MKKILLSAVFSFFAAIVAQAGILYWQVDTTQDDLAADSYKYASIFATSASSGTAGSLTGTLLNNYFPNSSISGTKVSTNFDKIGAMLDGDYTGQSFFVELYDSPTGKATYQSGLVSYKDVRDFISTAEFGANWSSINAYRFSNFTATPEPTSSLLMLLGAALLGLRRRKVA